MEEWEIIQGNACIDHIHLVVSIPSKMSVPGLVGSFERFYNLKR